MMAGPEKIIEIHPEARLDRRENDLEIPLDRLDLYAKLSLFAGKEKDVRYFEKFPGTAMVRRYRRGEVVCRQGESGWTAFYILTSEDMLRLLEEFPADRVAGRERTRLEEEKAALRRIIAEPPPAADGAPRGAASVYLTLGRTPPEKRPGWLPRLFGAAGIGRPRRPVAIPIDGPTDLRYDERKAVLREGDLFGEMSCIYRTPRSADVVADRDCYMLEMLRNILDQLKRDPKFQKRMDDEYRSRALGLQLLNIPLFEGADDAVIQLVRAKAELKTFRAGQILCDEHDQADEMFLIRNGLVKVVHGISSLFTADDVGRWRLAPLVETETTGPRTKLWSAIPAEARPPLGAPGEFGATPLPVRAAVAESFNRFIKGGPLWTQKDFESAARAPFFESRRSELPANPKEWSEQDVRWLNRVLIEAVLFGVSTFPRPAAGLETVLHYAGRGETIGEMGLMTGELRNATCLAYTHPREGQARKDVLKPEEEIVEVVRISRALFEELKGSAPFRRKVEGVIAERRRATVRVRQEAAAGAAPLQRSEEFDRLGLVQGQRLMLIDLDRCTRCDECVRACVNSHDDGRSRLFLEGPRFGQYLVPLSCRSCLDPVCMRGCPVGAIHRGANRQMIIEDWCIGCELCARQCPYGSIQMHDIGVVPQGALGWRFRPAEGEGDAWTHPGYRDGDWAVGPAPFRLNRDFEEAVRRFGGSTVSRRVWFRLSFTIGPELLNEKGGFNLMLLAPDEAARVWLNSVELQPEPSAKKKLERTYPIAEVAKIARAGRNVVAVSVETVAPAEKIKDFFDLRIDVVRKPHVPEALASQYEEKDVTLQAVVCDLCSSLPGQVPACVKACPHDAAMRVNARTEFPTR
jgi:Fe-S-cluster-containing hydrogenase component 2/CRP-like cAMP-binding protein